MSLGGRASLVVTMLGYAGCGCALLLAAVFVAAGGASAALAFGLAAAGIVVAVGAVGMVALRVGRSLGTRAIDTRVSGPRRIALGRSRRPGHQADGMM